MDGYLLNGYLQEFCKYLSKPLKDKELIMALAQGVKMYFNYTGQAPCLNISQDATGNLGDRGWDYQVHYF
jgi:lysosomal Pro-X carboxypeptidase